MVGTNGFLRFFLVSYDTSIFTLALKLSPTTLALKDRLVKLQLIVVLEITGD